MRINVLLASVLTAGTPIVAPLAGQSSPAEVIDRAVAAWAKITTVRGTFEQTVSNSLTGTSASSRGTFAQERPNRLAIRLGLSF